MLNYVTEVFYHVNDKDKQINNPHNDCSVELIQTWSEGGYFLAKDKIFLIEPGAVFLINAIETHCSNPENPNNYIRSKIIINYHYFKKLSELLKLDVYLSPLVFNSGGAVFCLEPNSSGTLKIDRLFSECAELFYQSPDDPLTEPKIISNLTQILLEIFSGSQDEQKKESISGNQKVSTLVINYINERISKYKPFSIDEMCRDLHLSRSYASHIFKKITDQSIMQYVTNLRIAEAKKILLGTDMKIKDAAERLDFQSCTVFCKVFKKYTGMSPTEYRNRNKV